MHCALVDPRNEHCKRTNLGDLSIWTGLVRLKVRVNTMNSAPGSEPGTIWLRRKNYRIVPLNSSLSGHTAALGLAIERGVYACPDLQRPDFYDIELENGRAYVHVHDDARAVYLVAYGNSASFIHSQSRNPETNRQGIDEHVHG